MELSNVSIARARPMAMGPPAQVAVPVPVADTRPTADAAALAHDTQPALPLAMAPVTNQLGAVSKALVASAPTATDSTTEEEVSAIQRVLKPYGIAMLPERFDAPQPDPEAS